MNPVRDQRNVAQENEERKEPTNGGNRERRLRSVPTTQVSRLEAKTKNQMARSEAAHEKDQTTDDRNR
jgi:hypothetical protein